MKNHSETDFPGSVLLPSGQADSPVSAFHRLTLSKRQRELLFTAAQQTRNHITALQLQPMLFASA